MLPESTRSQCRILVVEESELIVRLCRMVLLKAGFTQVLAVSPKEALVALKSLSTDLRIILLDTAAPPEVARQLLEEIEADIKFEHVAVVALSDVSRPVSLVAKYPCIMGVLKKPFYPRDLVEMVLGVLEKSNRNALQTRRQMQPLRANDHLRANKKNPVAPLSATTNQRLTPLTGIKVFEGQIEFMPPSEVLQLLQMQRQSGVLRMDYDQEECSVFFDNGEVDFATATGLAEELKVGRILVRQQKLSSAALQENLQEQNQKPSPLGQLLLDKGLISKSELTDALKEQTRYLIFHMIQKKSGRFCFEKFLQKPDAAVWAGLNLSVPALILEAHQRLDELKTFEEAVGDLATILEAVPERQAPQWRDLSPFDLEVLHHARKGKNLGEIVRETCLPKFEFYRICQNLLARKLVRKRPLAFQV